MTRAAYAEIDVWTRVSLPWRCRACYNSPMTQSPNLPPDRLQAAFAVAEGWFAARGWQVFDFQREVWQAYLRGESGLIHAPTGTGKTLAAWWGPLLHWLAEAPAKSPQPTPTALATT